MAIADLALSARHRPPSPDGMGVGTALAVLVHLGLVAALAYGVAWRRSEVNTVSAELWAAVPQIAAPMATQAPPPPPAPPAPTPKPVTAPPAPPPPPQPKAEPQPSRDADIALEKARKKAQAERDEAQRLAEKKQADDKKADLKKAEEQKAAEKKADEKKARDKREAEKAEKAEKEEAKRLADKKEADAKARADAAKDAKADKAQAERLAKLRAENLQRMSRDLGENPAVGNSTTPSAGTAAKSAAPSAGYEGRIRARILPNIVFTGDVARSMQAEVEVRVAPDGAIIGKRLLKSSGVAEWDQAVLRAIERTEILPRDIDGRVPPLMVLSFDPTKR